MSYEDLKEHDIFLPEKHWDKVDLSSSVNELALTLVYVLGVVSCVLMAVGGGHMLTWAGVLGFLLFMFLFTLVSNAGIEAQNKVVDDLLREEKASSSNQPAETTETSDA
jgi:hypothetical protein